AGCGAGELMPERHECEMFTLRYAPDAVKEEFVNIGLLLVEQGAFAGVRFARDLSRLRCLDEDADLEMLKSLEEELQRKVERAGPDRDKLIKLVTDTFSNTLQLSSAKAVLAASPEKELELLARMYLEPADREKEARVVAGRAAIYTAMREAFSAA